MTTNTAKIVTLLTVLIVSVIMSGCISPELIDSQAPINADVNVITHQDIEPIPELAVESTPETVPTPKKHHIQVAVSQRADSLLVSVNGGDDYQQLREIQVTVNNETLDIYTPEYQVLKPIPCTIIGEWKVVCRGIFEDGEIHTLLTTDFGGLPDSYVETTIAPERYVEPSETSREEAKRICEENGVTWDCDDPVVTPTAVPTPEPTPTPTATPTQTTPTRSREEWATESHIGSTYKGTFTYVIEHPDEIVFGTISTRYGGWREGDSYDQIEHVEIFIGNEMIASFKPTIIDNPSGGHRIMNNTIRIKLPNGSDNLNEIRIVGSFINLGGDYVDGEYRMYTSLRKISLESVYGYKYNYIYDYPICDGIYYGK